jgi:hypothetical protein
LLLNGGFRFVLKLVTTTFRSHGRNFSVTVTVSARPRHLVLSSIETPEVMANQEHLDILDKGIRPWSLWRHQNPGIAPDLAGADLRDFSIGGANLDRANLIGANLAGASLWGAEFRHAQLQMAHLNGVDLGGAKLEGANLAGADLSDASLSRADLTDADFSDAKLVWTTFRGGSLAGANFSGAHLLGTVFAEVDLRPVIGLTTCVHHGPSTIGIETIRLSQGQIPELFLRGAGVQEDIVKFVRSPMGEATTKYYSCFISHSAKDQDLAELLYADLQSSGILCWLATYDLQGGQKIHDQIHKAMHAYDKLLLILSDASMSSNWVKTEIAKARAREELQKRPMLFPIRIVPYERIRDWELFDADAGIDSAREIREYFIPDFSNWKDHDTYLKLFGRLVEDLKAGPDGKPPEPAT